MDLLKLSFILSCVLSFTMIPTSLAQDTPQDFLNAHNTARDQVGVQHLQWNETLENYAKQYAEERINDCDLVHSNGPYGENLAWGSPSLTDIDAVNLWVDEEQYYDYDTNSCANGEVCGHYTQVVWSNSIRMGCAKVRCKNDGGDFIICNYDPPGNVVGEKPY